MLVNIIVIIVIVYYYYFHCRINHLADHPCLLRCSQKKPEWGQDSLKQKSIDEEGAGGQEEEEEEEEE